jgi:ABC-type amino acid transport system permease subunit
MNLSIDRLSPNFLPSFLAGMAVNFEIAAIALALGLILGVLLALARVYGGATGIAAGSIVGLMRAAPTFVVMFFLLNALPRDARLSGVMIVAMSLVTPPPMSPTAPSMRCISSAPVRRLPAF